MEDLDVFSVLSRRRRRTTMVAAADGSKSLMDSVSLLRSFFKDTKDSVPGNKGVNLERLNAFEQRITEDNKIIETLALASGVTLGSRGALNSVLSHTPSDT
jgi:hypothetical protein